MTKLESIERNNTRPGEVNIGEPLKTRNIGDKWISTIWPPTRMCHARWRRHAFVLGNFTKMPHRVERGILLIGLELHSEVISVKWFALLLSE